MKFSHLYLFVFAAGCALDTFEEPDLGEVASASICTDPDRCGPSNGGGVYTEELGTVGIGANEFMITHFVNHPSSTVTLSGRRFDPINQTWRVDSGIVNYAEYNGVAYDYVLSVTESFTTPTWTLSNDGGVTTTDVTGSNIMDLTLYVSLNDGTTVELYALTFVGSPTNPDAMILEAGVNSTLRMSNMRWQVSKPPEQSWHVYCRREDATEDPIVFQEGFAVNAVTADLVQNDAFVTLACRHGGPPTVRLWGYPYRNVPNINLFRAALHMKRASYCGDEAFYTRANTNINISDYQNIENGITPPDPATIEASWGVNGATCVNDASHRRRPGVRYPAGTGTVFNGKCNGVTLPACTSMGMLASQKQ